MDKLSGTSPIDNTRNDVSILNTLATRIAVNPFSTIILTDKEKGAILWASLLISGDNVKFKVVER